jgi:AraC family transcriptional regulator of adaptative response/methylated-DNA-[protein]-cysteine methyltransferase
MTELTHENAYHFQVMRRALDEIDAGGSALSLDDLASRMGMSPSHFQRIFSQWVGVSPKKYQQYLTLDHARQVLQDRFTTLEAAGEVGLSGTGRLHDLFVSWEAMTPGEFAKGGSGLTIYWGWFDTPFGEALAMGTARGLCGLAFSAETGRDEAMRDLKSRWPNALYEEHPEAIRSWVETTFGQSGETKLHMIGAPFQIKVWEALLRIPSGHVTTYSELAQSVGHPKAVRAVGTAVGRNPVSFLIPCHRALRKSGALGGYHWGLPVKRAILAWESARIET